MNCHKGNKSAGNSSRRGGWESDERNYDSVEKVGEKEDSDINSLYFWIFEF